jgi:hypothetical protein
MTSPGSGIGIGTSVFSINRACHRDLRVADPCATHLVAFTFSSASSVVAKLRRRRLKRLNSSHSVAAIKYPVIDPWLDTATASRWATIRYWPNLRVNSDAGTTSTIFVCLARLVSIQAAARVIYANCGWRCFAAGAFSLDKGTSIVGDEVSIADLILIPICIISRSRPKGRRSFVTAGFSNGSSACGAARASSARRSKGSRQPLDLSVAIDACAINSHRARRARPRSLRTR